MNFEDEVKNKIRDEISLYIGVKTNNYILKNSLSEKEIKLISDFSQYIQFDLDGKTEEQRVNEAMNNIFLELTQKE